MTTEIEFNHSDLLDQLNKRGTLSEKIQSIHQVVKQSCGFVHRIAISIYDPKLDLVSTFAHSTDNGNPLHHYQAKLADAASLHQIYTSRKARVINDLSVFMESTQKHSKRIIAQGFRASYTIPMFDNDQLTGFVFFNSRQPNVFQEDKLLQLDMIARLISLLVGMELSQVSTLRGALKTASSFSSHRDPETGAHLERMARFARLIAHGIARDYGMDDEFAEAIFWCAPMHDIGKIAIPDAILLKPGSLTQEEFNLMKTHTIKGRQLINTMLGNFNLSHSSLSSMMCNIAEYHHENLDGSGYPHRLQGEEIPIEARIIAVADVFDALTSKRSYKLAWSNEDAFLELLALSKWKLDSKCVDILIGNRSAIEEIQSQFQDEQESIATGSLSAHAGAIHLPSPPAPPLQPLQDRSFI